MNALTAISDTTMKISNNDLQNLAAEMARRLGKHSAEEYAALFTRNFTDSESGSFKCPEHLDAECREVVTLLTEMALTRSTEIMERRPETLECDVWRFQNKKEKWVAFVGLLDGRPYEIFTGILDDEDGIALPKLCNSGHIIKRYSPDGSKRYDFQFANRRGYKTTIEVLSEEFNPEYWNYAKLISGVLRYRMPIENVIRLIESLELETETINTWKSGVVRALKKYTIEPDNED